jgi:hypothetical protein
VGIGRHWRPSERSEWKTPAVTLTVAAIVIPSAIGLFGIWRDMTDFTINKPSSTPTVAAAPQQPLRPAPVVQTAEARHRGRIELKPGGSANLDAPQSLADWTYNDGNPDEIRYSPDTGLTMGSGEIVTLERTPATYASCLSATGYTRRSFEFAYLISGDYYCVRTSERRIATLHLIGPREDLVTIDVVAYEPQE